MDKTRRAAAGVAGATLGVALSLVPAGNADAAAPPRPSAVHVTNGTGGTYLTWKASGATRFQVEQSLDATFRTGRRIYSLSDGRVRQFTPYSNQPATPYYWRVRAFSGSAASPWSAMVTAAPMTREQRIRVEQYNVSNEDGQREPGGVVATWSQRRTAVAALIRQAHPDVAAVEEASDWVGAVKGPRMIDDIVSLLGAPYALARTEVPPGEPGWFRTGDYLIYDSSRYEAVGDGGHWSVGDPAWEVYQVLRNRASGATFLFIGTHISGASGASGDAIRRTQTQRVIQNARSYAAAHGNIPVIYAGDFNSHEGPNHAYDGPGVAMRAALVNDSPVAAQQRSGTQFNSANDYYRTPPAHARYLDRIFAPAGVGVLSWRQWLNLSHGKYVGVIPSDHNPISSDLVFPYV